MMYIYLGQNYDLNQGISIKLDSRHNQGAYVNAIPHYSLGKLYIYIYIHVLYIDKYILNIEIFIFNNSCSFSFIFHFLQRNWTSNWYIIKLSICVTKVKYQRFSMKNSRTSPAALFCGHYLPRRTPDKHMGLGNSFFVYITQETEATFPKREISPNALVFVSTA